MKNEHEYVKPTRYNKLQVSECNVNARAFMRNENGIKCATFDNVTIMDNKVVYTFKGWDNYKVIVYRNIFRIKDEF